MVRRHGWQLPAHTFQVLAIVVYFILVVAFYIFFAPYVGKPYLEYAAIAIYTTVALAVFFLYVRCTSINPADPGIMSRFDGSFINLPTSNNVGLPGLSLPSRDGRDHASGVNSPSSACRSSVDGHSDQGGSAMDVSRANIIVNQRRKTPWCYCFGGIIYVLFTKEDCRKLDDTAANAEGEEALFCTLCNAEVRKFSKHCRSCDKCVDGFDHHCRWLNNCVGRKNYCSFIALMSAGLIWLLFEFGVGVAVIVLFFVNKEATENRIAEKLANEFPHALFVVIVAVCTVLSLVACVPLGELFFFHMLLISKGITTYEYVVAMRAMSEEAPPASVDEEGANSNYSPSNSVTTGFSGASSRGGLHYKGVWCTPPRVFVDQKDEVIPHLDPGMVPSTVDPDAVGYTDQAGKSKKPVKISAWNLAKLDTNEVMKAAAKARASSSVLRPIDGGRRGAADAAADVSSSGNVSVRSSTSFDYHAPRELGAEPKPSLYGNSYPQSLASQDDYDTGTQSIVSSLSSPVHVARLTALPPGAPPAPIRPPFPVVVPRAPVPAPAIQMFNPPVKPSFQPAAAAGAAYSRENRRATVMWDQEAGRYVSVAASVRGGIGRELRMRPLGLVSSTNLIPGAGSFGTRPPTYLNTTSSSAQPVPPSMQTADRMAAYPGQSIFFGASVVAASDAGRDEQSSVTGPDMRRPPPPYGGVGGQGRGRGDNFPVFAPPTTHGGMKKDGN